eukprot:Skav233825  [mRNA]  locus=scaffold100:46668:49273:+ [translate_table: standard]
MTHIVPKPNPAFTPFWIRRNTAEANDAYLRRVLMLKESRKQPVLFRFGPGDNLGFEKRAEDTIAPKPRNHVIYGLPRAWGADDVETLLANQNWSQVGHIVRRKRSWVVSAQAPPDSATRTSWHYDLQYSDQVQDTIAVTIQVAVRSPDRLEVRQRMPGPRRVQDPVVRVEQPATKESSGATATEDLSKAQAAAPAEARDSKDKDDRGRSRSRGRDATAPTQIDPGSQMEQDQEGDSGTAALDETKTKKQKVGEPIDPADAVQNFKWREWDQGGSGDCFYRSCSLFLKDFHAQPDRERSRQEGAWLRSETVKHVRKHCGRFQELFQNFEEYKAWQTKCGNASAWAEGKAIQACSEKIGRPVVVWEKKQDSDGVITYNRFVLAPRFSRGFACSADDKVICVILCDKHYTALLPPRDSKFPASWLRETPDVVVQLDGGTSAGHRTGAEGVRAGSSSVCAPQHGLVPVVSFPQVSGLSQGEGRRAEGASPAARSARSSGCGRPLRRLRAKTLCSLASSESSCAGAHSVAPSVWSPSRFLPDLPTPSVHSVVPASLGPSLRTRSVHTMVSGSVSRPGLPTPSAHAWVHSAHASSQPNSLRPSEPSLAGFANSDPANQPLGKQNVWDLPDVPATGLIASKDQNLAVNVGDQEFICVFVAATRQKIKEKRWNHVRLKHKGNYVPADRPFKPPVQIIEASANIPEDQRCWTCAFCDAGLPSCTAHQKVKSIAHHYKVHHPRRKLDFASKGKARRLRRKRTGKDGPKKPGLREKNAAARDLSRNGHQLVLWGPRLPTWPGNKRPGPRYTCVKCWRYGAYDPQWDSVPCAVQSRGPLLVAN